MLLTLTSLVFAAEPPSPSVVREYLPDVVGEVRPGPPGFALDFDLTTPRGILFTRFDDFGDGPVPAGHFYEQLLPTSVAVTGGTIEAYVQVTAESDDNTNWPKLGERSKVVNAGAHVPGAGIFEWRVGGSAPELVLPKEFAAGTEWISGNHRRFVVSTDVTARWVEGNGIWTAEHCLAIAEHPIPYDGYLDVEYRCPNGYGVVAAWRDYPDRGERTVFFKARRMSWKITRSDLPAADVYQTSVARVVAGLPTTLATAVAAATAPSATGNTASTSVPGSPAATASKSPASTGQPSAPAPSSPSTGSGVAALFPGVNVHRGEAPWSGREIGDNGWGDAVYSAPFTLLKVPGSVVWSTCDAGAYADDPESSGRIIEQLGWSVVYAAAGAGVPEDEVVQTLPPPYQRGDETEFAWRTARAIIATLRSQGWNELPAATATAAPGADRDETVQFQLGEERVGVRLAVVPGRSDPSMRVGIVQLDVLVSETCPAP